MNVEHPPPTARHLAQGGRQRARGALLDIAGATTYVEERSRIRDNPLVTDLVTRARKGDQQAWDALVERYSPLIWSICRQYRLSDADAKDVGQAVWLRLVDQLDNLRDPAALPGWLKTTTRRECFRVQRATCRHSAAWEVPDLGNIPDQRTATVDHELLWPSATPRSARLSRACPLAASDCLHCLSLTLHCRTPSLVTGWGFQSGALDLTAAVAWTGCAATRQSLP